MAADGGYASRDNLEQAKARGVNDIALQEARYRKHAVKTAGVV
jgi:hypothetical protein